MRIDNFKIGTDIEVFIQDKNTKKFISAAGDEISNYVPLIPGSKHSPYYIDEDKEFAMETDNVSVEFLIPPTTVSGDFIKNINFMMKHIQDTLHSGYILVPKASQVFDKDQLLTQQAMTFGCDQDFNAWTRKFNPKPDTNTNLRSNGFHIHVGYDNPNRTTSIELIRAMDLFLGLGSILLDTDNERRKIYGKAGACRFKKYGVEYRVLSSFLISNNNLIKWTFDNTIKAIEFINDNQTVPNELANDIQDIINNYKVDEALTLMNHFGIKTELITI